MDQGAWQATFYGVERVRHDWVTNRAACIAEWSSGFPYFLQFKSEFGNKELIIWATVSFWSFFLLTIYSFPIICCQEYNQSDFSFDHLVMSMCRVFSCVVGKGCFAMTSAFSCKTLLAFALLHFILQGPICLLLQVYFCFLLLHSSPL